MWSRERKGTNDALGASESQPLTLTQNGQRTGAVTGAIREAGRCGLVVGLMGMEGHQGSLGEHLMQRRGSAAQGHREKNIFYPVASEGWDPGMRAAWPGRWVHGRDPLLLAPRGATPARHTSSSAPVRAPAL